MNKEQLLYLKSRGYTKSLFEEDQVKSVEQDSDYIDGVAIEGRQGYLAWTTTSMSGETTSVVTRSVVGKDYKSHFRAGFEHLPNFYCSVRDWQLIWEQGEVLICEGLFDRVALKRSFPDKPAIARLTTGLSPILTRVLKRHSKRVYLFWDMDEAGEKAAKKSLSVLGPMAARVSYPASDPNDLLLKVGLDRTRDIFTRRMELVL